MCHGFAHLLPAFSLPWMQIDPKTGFAFVTLTGAAAGFAALDFAAGFGLEAAVAGFGDAGLDVDGDLAMYSPTPRFDKNAAATGVQHRIATIRHITGV